MLEKYWTGVAKRLQHEATFFNGLIPHMLERGEQNEITLARMLGNFLPPSIGVGSGIVFDAEGHTSRQSDIVLFEKSAQPQVLAQTTQVLFPVETVRMVLEVKTNLTSDDIEDAAIKKAALSALNPQPGHSHPTFGLFAYGFANSDYARAEELNNLEPETKPDAACVVTPGYVVHQREGLAGFTPLHQRGADEARMAGQFHRADANQPSVMVDGHEYPVFRFGMRTGPCYVGEPGRALLLFGVALLDLLGSATEHAWLGAYLQDEFRDLLQ